MLLPSQASARTTRGGARSGQSVISNENRRRSPLETITESPEKLIFAPALEMMSKISLSACRERRSRFITFASPAMAAIVRRNSTPVAFHTVITRRIFLLARNFEFLITMILHFYSKPAQKRQGKINIGPADK